jgi:hypothetical protein
MTHFVQLKLVEPAVDEGMVSHIHAVSESARLPPIEHLLEKYPDIFTAPTSMPPPRPFDHSIPCFLGLNLLILELTDTHRLKRMRLKSS